MTSAFWRDFSRSATRWCSRLLGVAAVVIGTLAIDSEAQGQFSKSTQVKSKVQGQTRMGADCGGSCTGDLNSDGLLNEIDLLVFDLYEDSFPQNDCADFNGDGVVDKEDRGFLLNVLGNHPGGACRETCGVVTRGCFTAALPGKPDSLGCNDPECCSRVCDDDPACCQVVWDAGCVTLATNRCVPFAPDLRPDAGDCIVEHPLGGLVACNNKVLAEVVCDIDPDCCGEFDPLTQTFTGLWDSDCATLATFIIITQPGLAIRSLPSSALLVAAPDGTLADQLVAVRARLCQIDPQYCGAGGALRFGQELRQDCLDQIERNYPACVDLFDQGLWDAACAQIANQLCRWPYPLDVGLGDCLRVHSGRGCSNGFCNSFICDNLDPTCCDSRWDEDCVRLAARWCLLTPDPATGRFGVEAVGAYQVGDTRPGEFGCGSKAAGSCCYENFNAYCDDAVCCQLVCSYDAYCCDARWDEFCAKLATDGCALLETTCTCGFRLVEFGPPGRSCFEERPLNAQWRTGCANGECCNSVCLIDPYCCDVHWDAICAEGAGQICLEFCQDQFGQEVPCYPACADILSGSCYVERETPGCDDEQCCQNVCAIDPKCCDEMWDSPCVELALTSCNSCGDIYAGSCLASNLSPACSDAFCCNSVCLIDSYCCEVQWDGACVSEAQMIPGCVAAESCGAPNARACVLASLTPGCSDASCCQKICSEYDPWCCDVRWDEVCAAEAFVFCSYPPPGGTRSPCDERHATPGCNVAECASKVCSIPGFEFCCDLRWDTACVQAADSLCVGLYECPGSGDCKKSHPTPMCDDPTCCNGVCAIDLTCCRVEWDNSCAVLAIELCRIPSGQDWECPCEGDCFTVRLDPDGNPLPPKPGCNDKSCCTVVCQIDPFCCTEDWDAGCVDLAVSRCTSVPACGSDIAGSCVEPHESPFCDDAVCCSAVCALDPICCLDRWDGFCVEVAIERCRRGCGIPSSGTCFYPHVTPGCAEQECCVAVCDDDPFCCTDSWDDVCAYAALGDPEADPPVPGLCVGPECGEYAAGDCCRVNLSPSCEDKRCCNAVCAVDEFCCVTTWDEACVQLAREETRCGCGADWQCGDVCAGDCCVPNFTPKCNDSTCCNAVCDADEFCCETEWDIECAIAAQGTPECNGQDDACPAPECGDVDAGDCCFAHGTPACSDMDCCDDVCAIDPVCCDVAWDGICAATAAVECTLCNGDLQCGSADAGPCGTPNPTPYCSDEACCSLVCQIEFFCCVGAWDQYCADIAQALCN